jgi:F-type H+-transporting ATPase subunit delta
MCVDDENVLLQIEKDLTMLASLMNDKASELRTMLLNPAFRREEQVQILTEVASALQVHPLTKNFLLLLLEKGRVSVLPLVAKIFSSEIDTRLLRVRAHVTSAAPLSEQDLGEIVESLRLRAGKNVIADVEVDPRVGLGVKAQIGGLVFDATLSTMLERFKRKLVDAPIGA